MIAAAAKIIRAPLTIFPIIGTGQFLLDDLQRDSDNNLIEILPGDIQRLQDQ